MKATLASGRTEGSAQQQLIDDLQVLRRSDDGGFLHLHYTGDDNTPSDSIRLMPWIDLQEELDIDVKYCRIARGLENKWSGSAVTTSYLLNMFITTTKKSSLSSL